MPLSRLLSIFPDSKKPGRQSRVFYVSGTDAPEAIVRSKGFKQVSDRGELGSLIDRVFGEQLYQGERFFSSSVRT